jgi:hypothetical protein
MPESIEEYKRDYDNLKREKEILIQKLDVYENENLEKEGYYVLKSWIKQQIDIIKDCKLKDEIGKNPKDDKYYDRVKALGEDLQKMITGLNALRTELKITVKDDDMFGRRQRTSPESIADSIGNTAGQNM